MLPTEVYWDIVPFIGLSSSINLICTSAKMQSIFDRRIRIQLSSLLIEMSCQQELQDLQQLLSRIYARELYEDHNLVMSNLRSSFIKTIELANWWLRFVERTRNIQLPAIEWDKNSSFLEQLQVLCLMTGQLRAHEIYQPAFDAENDILIILLQLKTVCNALLDSRKKDARDVLQTPSPPPLHDTTAFPSLSEPSNAYSLASLAQPSAPPQPSQSSVNAQPMDSQRASSSTSDAVAPKLSLSSFAACDQSSSGLASILSCAPTPVSVPAFKSGVGSQPMKKQSIISKIIYLTLRYYDPITV
uniref:F-box domain-containing protein n=1 Tax=Ditylenchus dipsaci TaxID=166011 RepID=A0A915ELS6_9BILA